MTLISGWTIPLNTGRTLMNSNQKHLRKVFQASSGSMCVCVKFVRVKKWKTKIQALMCHFLPFSVTFLLPHYAVRQTPAHWTQSGLKCVPLPRPQILWSLALYTGIGPFLWWKESSIRNEGKSTHRRKTAIKRREGEESRVWLLWIKESLSVKVCICCRTPAMRERERGRALSVCCTRQTGIKDILVICDYSSRYLLSCFL